MTGTGVEMPWRVGVAVGAADGAGVGVKADGTGVEIGEDFVSAAPVTQKNSIATAKKKEKSRRKDRFDTDRFLS